MKDCTYGCDACRLGMLSTGHQPRKLATSYKSYAILYKCDLCNSWWIETEKESRVVPGKEAKEKFPDYFSK